MERFISIRQFESRTNRSIINAKATQRNSCSQRAYSPSLHGSVFGARSTVRYAMVFKRLPEVLISPHLPLSEKI